MIPFPAISSTLVSTSYAASCTDLVSTPDNTIVTGVTYDSGSPYSSGWVTGDFAVYEAISVPGQYLPVTAVWFLASELTIIESTVLSSQFENWPGMTRNQYLGGGVPLCQCFFIYCKRRGFWEPDVAYWKLFIMNQTLFTRNKEIIIIIMHSLHNNFVMVYNILLWEETFQSALNLCPTYILFRSKIRCNFYCSPDTGGEGCDRCFSNQPPLLIIINYLL